MNWIINCVIQSSVIIDANQIDIILVSHGPPHILFTGFLLKLKHSKCKLISDYRDSWTDNPYRKFPSIILKKGLEIIEYDIIKKSSIILVVSRVEKLRFTRKYQNIEDKIRIIRNGFFKLDIKIDKKRDFFKITHAGSFLKIKQPDLLLNSYKYFLEINPKSKLFLIGELDTNSLFKIKKLGLEKSIVITGNVDYSISLKNIYDSDLLFFYEPTDAITTKIYDYLSSGNPILAVTQNIEAIKFIQKYSPYSSIIKEYDKNLIITSMQKYYMEWINGKKYKFILKNEFYEKYNREKIAEQLTFYIKHIRYTSLKFNLFGLSLDHQN